MIGYDYPDAPHQRRHGPQGYDSYASYKPWLRDEFMFRCVYCLTREQWSQSSADVFGVDHFKPQVNHPYLTVDYENLVYACVRCNSHKGDSRILDPCEVALSEHLQVADDGSIQGLTPEGGKYLAKLGLNDPVFSSFRSRLINTLKYFEASDDLVAHELARQWLGFPDDLPDLTRLRPKSNSRPEGVNNSFHALRAKGELPETY